MVLDHDYSMYHIHTPHIHTTYTQNCGDSILCHTVPHPVRLDPRVRQRIYTSLDVFRSRRMDHTVFHKWLIKQTIYSPITLYRHLDLSPCHTHTWETFENADYSMYSTFLTDSPGSVLFTRSNLLKRKDLCFS